MINKETLKSRKNFIYVFFQKCVNGFFYSFTSIALPFKISISLQSFFFIKTLQTIGRRRHKMDINWIFHLCVFQLWFASWVLWVLPKLSWIDYVQFFRWKIEKTKFKTILLLGYHPRQRLTEMQISVFKN